MRKESFKEFAELSRRINRHRNQCIMFLIELLGEWEDNQGIPDETEVCGITQGHLRMAKKILNRTAPYPPRVNPTPAPNADAAEQAE